MCAISNLFLLRHGTLLSGKQPKHRENIKEENGSPAVKERHSVAFRIPTTPDVMRTLALDHRFET